MYYFCQKKLIFYQKNVDISKIKRALVLKGIFSETNMRVYLGAKFVVSSIILTNFGQGGNFTPPPPPPQNKPLKSPPRLWLNNQTKQPCADLNIEIGISKIAIFSKIR